MSTELQGFHYYQGKIQSTTCGYNISLSPTRQENTILSSYVAARLLGIISHGYTLILNLIYIFIYIYMSKSAVLGIIFLVEFGQLGLVAIQATRAHFNNVDLHERISLS